MRIFEIYDHVAVQQNSSLYGTVVGTNTDSLDSLEDELIIAHTEVPPDILNDFVTTSIPPLGYVFVRFADEATGSALVAEDDLVLLSRAFQVGDIVKQDGRTMTGTVIDVDEKYTLEPIASRKEVAKLLSINTTLPTCTPSCATGLPFFHPNPHALIYDVPSREVIRAQDVGKDEYIISNGWVGLVDDAEYNVVIGLENESIVVVSSINCLHIPVPDHGKPLVALPESDGFKRPDILVATQGWASTIPVQAPRPGYFVIIDRRRLRSGRWLRGSYDPKCPAQGVVLDVRACEVAVDWLSNCEIRGDPIFKEHFPLPPYEVQLYAGGPHFGNGIDFGNGTDLTRRLDVTPYNCGRMPTKSVNGVQHGANQDSKTLPNNAHEDKDGGLQEPNMNFQPGSTKYHHKEAEGTQNLFPGQDLAIGTHVRFRDTAAAAVKYQGIGDTSHGRFIRVTSETFNGWDFNEFKVIHVQQNATVLWQDGTTTMMNSSLLHDHGLFEAELAPTDIVFKREGMRQRSVGRRGAETAIKDFDEMVFFEGPHDLLPEKVGVVQTVDPNERVARVRWYKEPKIEIRAAGQILGPGSRFGPIGDVIEDVSLYEILSFPALARRRRDMCVIAKPEDVSERLERQDEKDAAGEPPPEATAQTWRIPQGGWSQDVEWIGEIVALGLDGSISVRLGAAEHCRDVSIEPDGILAILDDREHQEIISNDMVSWADQDSLWSETPSVEPIAESVEYEGGERLDNDSGDDNWVSDEDMDFVDAEESFAEDADVGMTDVIAADIAHVRAFSVEPQRSISQLKTELPSESPPQFLVLESEPPRDQFGLHSKPAGEKAVKRIMREQRILATTLPEGEIYVRTYESRLDLLRCLIIGPRDTPYENAPFLIDLYLPEDFPDRPPTAHFHSWTSGLGRINPNLYEEGKICLSLLGTWSGKDESEKWSDKATILQLLVSLQGLVFVKRPFYNEAGFEGYENDSRYTLEAEQYSEKAFVMARGFIKHALCRPPGGLKDILAWLYLPRGPSNPANSLLGTVLQRGRQLIEKSEQARLEKDTRLLDSSGDKDDPTRVFLRPLSRGASVMLKRLIDEMQGQLTLLLHSDGGN
ncbi:hypothetical protein PV11_07489 [Exophiala sideris]|uniref:UBC core domain-containing protein n=1 Tax=Exophiala sideris TaxID=1016849 RepID=A0A0D1VUT0_9EURO|nr:hypothetical protein PV11_07489 [Exophiala sideris]